MPTLSPTTVKRLAFMKYLYQLGVSQSYLPEPANASSVLILHDATELLLQIASEVLDVGKSQVHFLEYWDLISPRLQPDGLPQRESYRRLNSSRVALKHHGTLPSSLDIESFRNTAKLFFEESVPVIFGLKFREISLVDFVETEGPRSALREAVTSHSKGDFPQAVASASLAFHLLLREYQQRTQYQRRQSMFRGINRLAFIDSRSVGLGHGHDQVLATRDFSRKLGEFVDGVKEAMEEMDHTLTILSMDIHYPKYAKFLALAPRVYWTMDGKHHVEQPSSSCTADQVQFCIDFAIEVALKLQEFTENSAAVDIDGA